MCVCVCVCVCMCMRENSLNVSIEIDRLKLQAFIHKRTHVHTQVCTYSIIYGRVCRVAYVHCQVWLCVYQWLYLLVGSDLLRLGSENHDCCFVCLAMVFVIQLFPSNWPLLPPVACIYQYLSLFSDRPFSKARK